MMMKSKGYNAIYNINNNSFMLPHARGNGFGHINHATDSIDPPFVLEEYSGLKVRHRWDVKGLGRLYILS